MFDLASPYLTNILLAYSAFLLGIISPGPNILAIMNTSMRFGRIHGTALAMGIACGSLSWAILTLIGITSVLTTFPMILTVIKIFGGGYILWLSYTAFKAASSAAPIVAREITGTEKQYFRYFLRGYLIQMTNPKAALVWIAIMSIGSQPNTPLWVDTSLILGTFFLSVILHVLYALAFSSNPMIALYAKAKRAIQTVVGTLFALIGLPILFEGVSDSLD